MAHKENLLLEKEFDQVYDELDHLARMISSLKRHIEVTK